MLGGVPLLESPDKGAEPASSISWNFRDNAWQGKAKAPCGTWIKCTKCVSRRIGKETDALYQKPWPEAKEFVYQEMLEWVAQVQQGKQSVDSES